MPREGPDRAKKRKDKESRRINIKEKMTEILELPKEVVLNVPRLTMLGNKNLVIENYKGIIEYETVRIRINTGTGIIKITGELLTIKEITSEDIMVEGRIKGLEFLE
ncbi:sporulation protein YqfC [Anaerobacterium chartisolvens]|uniref:Sporulation protein YqfC n=1 Tax=Anaerobacterium chartisolvens TaxID=1297424 RepID=A0A369AWU2_9FIRM|nr:sporulation protein YqfC [Anaerobacterium chartisolvens]RCX13852.1 sporulation protein YqfC [Anaerobacterium chartisolvens]